MRASVNCKAGLGKVLKSDLKVSDGQTQVTLLLPPWTELHAF